MKTFYDTEHNNLCILDTKDVENIEEIAKSSIHKEAYSFILLPKCYRYHVLEDEVKKMLVKDGGILLHYIE